jgi:hypothetical protein
MNSTSAGSLYKLGSSSGVLPAREPSCKLHCGSSSSPSPYQQLVAHLRHTQDQPPLQGGLALVVDQGRGWACRPGSLNPCCPCRPAVTLTTGCPCPLPPPPQVHTPVLNTPRSAATIAEALCEDAARTSARMLVVAVHGEEMAHFGSVARYCCQHSKVPVMLLPAQVGTGAGMWGPPDGVQQPRHAASCPSQPCISSACCPSQPCLSTACCYLLAAAITHLSLCTGSVQCHRAECLLSLLPPGRSLSAAAAPSTMCFWLWPTTTAS